MDRQTPLAHRGWLRDGFGWGPLGGDGVTVHGNMQIKCDSGNGGGEQRLGGWEGEEEGGNGQRNGKARREVAQVVLAASWRRVRV